MMTESELYQLVMRRLDHWTWDRVESTLTSGQPDCIASHGWKSHRIELKVTKGTICWFEPSQISWANRMRRNYVHNAWVIAYHPKKDIPHLFAYSYVPQKARSQPSKKKYSLCVQDIPLVHSSWESIDRALRYNYG